jgi:hypothetical protein
MAIGSGLSSLFAMKTEVTPGTYLAPDRFFETTDMDGDADLTYIEGSGLKSGARFKRNAQAGISRISATGTATMPMTMKNMGTMWKWMIGSTQVATQIVTTTAWEQHHVPGATFTGISETIQQGKPDAAGVIQPFSYNGAKITDWEITIADGEEVMLKLTWDAWNCVTSQTLVSAAYVANNDTWNFADCNIFKLGGTPSTAGGKTTIAGGTAVSTAVKSFTLKGTNHFATDRYGLGNAGTKLEQIENDFCEITGEFSGELNVAQMRAPFIAGTSTAIEIALTGPVIAGANNYLLAFIVPTAKLTEYSSTVSGPDMIDCAGTFKAYDNEVDPVMQAKIVSTDVAI